ncbi:MAG: SpoIIIAH-like family protein, partial [Bacillota bacterium]|nr:SpoIIIAH-like family protein [Bacillota bacterium]
MIVTLKKKNILVGMIILLAASFLVINIFGMKSQASYQSMLEEYAERIDEEEDIFTVAGNPMEIGTQIEVPIESSYFMEYKLERDRIRSRQIDILREIVNNPNSISENRMEAQQRLFRISDNVEKELELESLLAAKGLEHTAVLIQAE